MIFHSSTKERVLDRSRHSGHCLFSFGWSRRFIVAFIFRKKPCCHPSRDSIKLMHRFKRRKEIVLRFREARTRDSSRQFSGLDGGERICEKKKNIYIYTHTRAHAFLSDYDKHKSFEIFRRKTFYPVTGRGVCVQNMFTFSGMIARL